MKCEKRDEKFLLVSDGSADENNAVSAIVDLLYKSNLSDDDKNDFGCGIDHSVDKSYVYIPAVYPPGRIITRTYKV